MKVLKFRSRTRPVPVEHPDGGTFNLKPFDTDKALEWKEKVEQAAKDGKSQREQWQEAIQYVADEIVDSIEGVVDVETGEKIDVTEEIKVAILGEVSEREIDFKIPELEPAENGPLPMKQKTDENGALIFRTEKRPANEPFFLWAMLEAGKLVLRREEAVKN